MTSSSCQGRLDGGSHPPVLAAAGIWRDSEIPSFAIMTRDAMPVILRPDDFGTWLHADIKMARRLIEGAP
jgi:putative SOS response-associated peptidase YedK